MHGLFIFAANVAAVRHEMPGQSFRTVRAVYSTIATHRFWSCFEMHDLTSYYVMRRPRLARFYGLTKAGA